MALMENVVRVGKTYKVRKRIPVDCRAAFGVSGEFLTRSLQTQDKREARERAVPILAEIEARIALIRGGSAPPVEAVDHQPVSRETAHAVIANWRQITIQDAHDRAWSGLLPSLGISDEASVVSRRMAALAGMADDLPPDFDDRLVAAFNRQGVAVRISHPVLKRMEIREAFREAWLDVERFTDAFRNDRFEGWPEGSATVASPSPTMASVPSAAPAPQATGYKLIDLFDLMAKTRPTEPRQRGYVRRLAEFLGDPDIADIKPIDLDRFLIDLRRFPMTKRPMDDVPFGDVIARFERDEPDYPRLHIKTVWNWTVVYKALFEFAVDRDLLLKNPAAKMMRKPSAEESEERLPYEPTDIKAIFDAPMFRGFTGNGYRAKPGNEIVKDHKFWLPILALWTGARVEELASLTVEEVKSEGGIAYIDLTDRPLKGDRRVKNASARRLIPLHDTLIATGFLDHVAGVGSGMLFPELAGDGKASIAFTKWWGRWCEVNAAKAGEGIDDPKKVFHSFRHAWKRAARQSPAKEEIHDLISGHKGGNAVARGYGRGVYLETLKQAIDQIEFPTFSLTD